MSNKLGNVIEIFSAPKGYKGSTRPISEALNCIESFGIENDKFAGKNCDRSIMVVGQIAYDIAKENNIDLSIGSLGENILVDFDPHTLKLGEVFTIDQVELQVTQMCSICTHLSVHDETLPTLIKDHRGIYCKILSNGTIKKGLKICKK